MQESILEYLEDYKSGTSRKHFFNCMNVVLVILTASITLTVLKKFSWEKDRRKGWKSGGGGGVRGVVVIHGFLKEKDLLLFLPKSRGVICPHPMPPLFQRPWYRPTRTSSHACISWCTASSLRITNFYFRLWFDIIPAKMIRNEKNNSISCT